MIKTPDLQWSDAYWYSDAEIIEIKKTREPDVICWYFYELDNERCIRFIYEELIIRRSGHVGSQTNLLVINPVTWEKNVLLKWISKEEAYKIVELINKYEDFIM